MTAEPNIKNRKSKMGIRADKMIKRNPGTAHEASCK